MFHRRGLLSGGILFACLLRSPMALAADTFYLDLLADGGAKLDRGDAAGAAKDLRIACFGLLDDPDLLAAGLVRLAIAQAQLGRQDDFTATYRRIVEVETRFGSYRKAGIPDDTRRAFEAKVAELISAADLTESGVFAGLASKVPAPAMETTDPKAKRAELDRRIEEEPTSVRWKLALAELDVSEDRPDAALKLIERVLASEPTNLEARCLRGRAEAADGHYDVAALDLSSCDRLTSDPQIAGALLSCWLKLRQLDKATQFLASLPEDVRRQPPIPDLAAKIAPSAH